MHSYVQLYVVRQLKELLKQPREYSFIQLCAAMHSYAQLCKEIYSYMQLHAARYLEGILEQPRGHSFMQMCLAICDYVQLCKAMHSFINKARHLEGLSEQFREYVFKSYVLGIRILEYQAVYLQLLCKILILKMQK